MFEFLIKGGALGLAAAIQPGPFQAYLLSQVGQRGWRRTLPAAMAPLISDAPIVVLMLLVVRQMPAGALSVIRAAGGVFLLYLAWRSFASLRKLPADAIESHDETNQIAAGHGLWQAALMNLLNPNPYIFWGTVGAVVFFEGWNQSPAAGTAFLAGMYAMLISGLALVTVAFGMIGAFSATTSRLLSLASAIALAGFGLLQLWSAL